MEGVGRYAKHLQVIAMGKKKSRCVEAMCFLLLVLHAWSQSHAQEQPLEQSLYPLSRALGCCLLPWGSLSHLVVCLLPNLFSFR